jgi:hypothetical protein
VLGGAGARAAVGEHGGEPEVAARLRRGEALGARHHQRLVEQRARDHGVAAAAVQLGDGEREAHPVASAGALLGVGDRVVLERERGVAAGGGEIADALGEGSAVARVAAGDRLGGGEQRAPERDRGARIAAGGELVDGAAGPAAGAAPVAADQVEAGQARRRDGAAERGAAFQRGGGALDDARARRRRQLLGEHGAELRVRDLEGAGRRIGGEHPHRDAVGERGLEGLARHQRLVDAPRFQRHDLDRDLAGEARQRRRQRVGHRARHAVGRLAVVEAADGAGVVGLDVGDRRVGVAERGGEQVAVEAVADHRGGAQHRAAGRRQAGEARQRGVARVLGQRHLQIGGDPCAVLAAQPALLRHQLERAQGMARVAAGGAVQGIPDGVADLAADRRRRQLERRAAIERRQVEAGAAARAAHRGDQPLGGLVGLGHRRRADAHADRLGRSHRQHQQHRGVGHRAHQVLEQAHDRRRRLVRVVDQQRERPAARRRDHQIRHRLGERPLAELGAVAARHQRRQRASARRLGALGPVVAGDRQQRADQLVDAGPRRARPRRRRHPQRVAAVELRAHADLGEQPGLADALLADHRQRASVPAARVAPGRVEIVELAVAAVQFAADADRPRRRARLALEPARHHAAHRRDLGQPVAHLVGALRPRARRRVAQGDDQLGQRGVERRRQRARVRRRRAPLLGEHLAGRGALERPSPGRQLVHHDAERVEIAARVERARPRLGRRVEEGAARQAGGAGQPEIGEPCRARRIGGEHHAVDQHVRRLEIGVDHAARVHRRQRVEHAAEQRVERARLGGLRRHRERRPVDELHGEELLPGVGEPVVEDGDHVGMSHARERDELVAQVGAALRARHDLQRDVLAGHAVERLVDHAEAAGAETLDELVALRGPRRRQGASHRAAIFAPRDANDKSPCRGEPDEPDDHRGRTRGHHHRVACAPSRKFCERCSGGAADRRHAEARADAERAEVCDRGGARRHRGHRERGERARAGEPVDQADEQRADPHAVRVRRLALQREHDAAHAEDDQHHRDERLGGGRRLGRELHARGQQHDADRQDRRGVAEAPERAEHRGPEGPGALGDQRRHRRQMIRLERVARAERRAERAAGGQRDHRKLTSASCRRRTPSLMFSIEQA